MSTATTYPPEVAWGTTTSFWPLTTAYSYPDDCLNFFHQEADDLLAFPPAAFVPTGGGLQNCLPDVVNSLIYPSPFLRLISSTSVSLGPFTCPVGWRTLATSTKDRTSTLALCCHP
jgi:hypothetical protein